MKIVIDGNIGSGKTTQLGLLEQKGWVVRREPIAKWPLKEFYADPARWAFLFHMVILETLRPLKTARHVIYERSLLSSRWVFWPVLRRQGHVTQIEHDTYDYFYERFSWNPEIYIFLSKTLDLAWDHIQARGQAGDEGVTREYLAELDAEYKNLVKSVPCKVYVLDANQSVEKIHEDICKVLVENELLVSDSVGNQVQKSGGRGREVPCAPFTHMCNLS
jgi:deoxyadenosine/deoxycytidine kinase